MKRITSFFLCLVLLCGVLTGCSLQDIAQKDVDRKTDGNITGENAVSGEIVNLMSGVTPQKSNVEQVSIGGANAASPMDFAVRLFQNSFSTNKNTMISPVSVLYALAMTANGAKGETLSQMEDVLGMAAPELNAYLKSYMDALPEAEKYKLSIANSIWLTDDARFSVEQAFLQTNADYYGADVYKVPFNEATLKEINSWVEDNTDGMIRDILDRIPPEAVMYLINAIAFDAEWREIYREHQIRDGVFTADSGEKQDVELMYSGEHLYLDDGNATGFMKPYADSKYAFVALLPKEGVSVREYVDSLTGEGLAFLLADPQQTTVHAAIPKFESGYSVEMSELLKSMGMGDAFDANAADFTGLGTSTEGNIFISRVLHKTFITVDEKGTKAGAATAVEANDTAAAIEEPKEVILDRPFVYMIVDYEANLPLFIGTLMKIA